MVDGWMCYDDCIVLFSSAVVGMHINIRETEKKEEEKNR